MQGRVTHAEGAGMGAPSNTSVHRILKRAVVGSPVVALRGRAAVAASRLGPAKLTSALITRYVVGGCKAPKLWCGHAELHGRHSDSQALLQFRPWTSYPALQRGPNLQVRSSNFESGTRAMRTGRGRMVTKERAHFAPQANLILSKVFKTSSHSQRSSSASGSGR